jgi:hypothetical protein
MLPDSGVPHGLPVPRVSVGPEPTAAWTHESDQLDSFLEASDAGDVKGDGFGDVIVGDAEYANASTTGRVWVYLGSASGLGRLRRLDDELDSRPEDPPT